MPILTNYATRANIISTEQYIDMIKYERNIEYQYTAAVDGETIVLIPALVGALRILHIVNEIRGMQVVDFSFNANTGQLNLLNGVSLAAGQTLFIVYVVLVTS